MEFSDFYARLIRGEAEAYAALLRDYGPRIHRFVGHRFPKQDPQDVVQETFISVFRMRKRGQLPDRSSHEYFERWLYRLAACRAVDLYRPIRRDTQLSDEAASLVSVEEPVSAFLEHQEQMDAVEQVLASFPEQEQDVVREIYINEKSFAAVARELGIPEGTARSHKCRALKKLRLALHGTDDPKNETGDASEAADAPTPEPDKAQPEVKT